MELVVASATTTCYSGYVQHDTVMLGATRTHNYAVGRDHRCAYKVETPPSIREALRDVTQRLDSKGVLNPGVMFKAKSQR